MKHQTALKKCKTVADRIKAANGLIGTPHANFQALRISRAWLFGSTAKGKKNPSDVDILIECKMVGDYQTTGRRAGRENARGNAKRTRRGYWIGQPICCYDEAIKYLNKGMYKISIHDFSIDGDYGDIAETKIMIYPKFMLEG